MKVYDLSIRGVDKIFRITIFYLNTMNISFSLLDK